MNWVIRAINVVKLTIQMLLLQNTENELTKALKTIVLVTKTVANKNRQIKLLKEPNNQMAKILEFNHQVIAEEFNRHLKKRCKG